MACSVLPMPSSEVPAQLDRIERDAGRAAGLAGRVERVEADVTDHEGRIRLLERESATGSLLRTWGERAMWILLLAGAAAMWHEHDTSQHPIAEVSP